MDKSLEIVLCVVAAAALVATVVWVMTMKMRGGMRFLVNTLAGGILIAGLSALGIIELPFNIFNTLIVGALGLPGVGVVIAASVLL